LKSQLKVHPHLQAVLLFITLLLAACSDVVFVSPQPQDAPDLYQIPENYQGIYINSDSDTMRIYPDKFVLTFLNNPLEINLSDENVKIRRAGEYFALNLHLDKYWGVYLGKQSGEQLEVASLDFSSLSEADIEWLKRQAGAETPVGEENKGKIRLILKPSPEIFNEMIKKGLFKNVTLLHRQKP
jgi:hypothetical protein